MNDLIPRMLRAIRLDASLYEEMEHDTNAMAQAIVVVLLAAIAGGLGRYGIFGIGGLFRGIAVALLSWAVWAAIITLLGTTVLKGRNTQSNIGEVLRVLGFAAAPGVLRLLGIVPFFGFFFYYLGTFWMLAATIIAVRQALDYESTGRAALLCLVAFIPFLLIQQLLPIELFY